MTSLSINPLAVEVESTKTDETLALEIESLLTTTDEIIAEAMVDFIFSSQLQHFQDKITRCVKFSFGERSFEEMQRIGKSFTLLKKEGEILLLQIEDIQAQKPLFDSVETSLRRVTRKIHFHFLKHKLLQKAAQFRQNAQYNHRDFILLQAEFRVLESSWENPSLKLKEFEKNGGAAVTASLSSIKTILDQIESKEGIARIEEGLKRL